jgi:hypothetical protein
VAITLAVAITKAASSSLASASPVFNTTAKVMEVIPKAIIMAAVTKLAVNSVAIIKTAISKTAITRVAITKTAVTISVFSAVHRELQSMLTL